MDTVVVSPIVKSFLAGSLSGTFSTLLFQPLDLVKTRLQSKAATTAVVHQGLEYKGASMLQVMTGVVRNERAIGLWRGFLPSFYRCVPGVGMYFSSLHMLKTEFFSERKPSLYESLILGASARTLTATLMIPFTVVKTRYESGNFKYSGVGNALYNIYTHEGRRGLSSGLSATLIRDAPFSGLYLMFYTKGKSWLSEEALMRPFGSLLHFGCGVGAGVCASVLTQPADVIKTRMQLKRNKDSMMTTVRKIYKINGMGGFFIGLAPRVLRRTLIAAMAWTVYEKIMQSLDLKT